MKALTILQPYAEMIVRGEKRVENRTWATNYRGLLYVHAGKGRTLWDDQLYAKRYPNAAWGAVVAIATLEECVHIENVGRGEFGERFPWLGEHDHTHGPWCWILENVTPIGPWPWRGAQGLFDIDPEELGRVANRELGIKEPADAVTPEPR